MVTPEITARVEQALALIRPYLVNDGGNLVLERITDDLVVHVRLEGACGTCPFSTMTMRNGVKESVMRSVPEIRDVIAIEATADC
jgi:hypothetical protein